MFESVMKQVRIPEGSLDGLIEFNNIDLGPDSQRRES